MKGFKDFIMRGNLIEIAVAFIIAAAFAKVVEAFTKLILDIIGLFGGSPDFSQVAIGPINIGVFITAVISFLMIAAIVYFGVVTPYEKVKARLTRKKADDEAAEEPTPTTEELLSEIRDLLKRN
ncbi:MAG: large conductance mechanosensitive channel protein MscL [Propionibacteriaceae bacterium]|nr:large conductance mechanosensitive channel protein MscL [Propionibacteriaceae bacterium]